MEKLKVTVEDIQRFKILMEVVDGKLRATDASAVLSLSYRYTLRLKRERKRDTSHIFYNYEKPDENMGSVPFFSLFFHIPGIDKIPIYA